ncbi:hypothetical protein BV898_07826 [Hypsibius exemplaris]|uniref:Uncharacterized protein n=1 Tax=Hypsibius exemplaris TaxID=2072580 RepID=A0A1W0WS81_HYPEX|nr:hypothetical protein BV898_07826 [Hypsibius exemplaris]
MGTSQQKINRRKKVKSTSGRLKERQTDQATSDLESPSDKLISIGSRKIVCVKVEDLQKRAKLSSSSDDLNGSCLFAICLPPS